MVQTSILNLVGKRVAGLAALAGTLIAMQTAWAGSPTPFVMTTEVVFPQGDGTFTVYEPDWICPAGTFHNLESVDNPPVAGAFTVTAVVEYNCDNGSGTFSILLHPQWNNGTQGGGFDLSGPWSLLSGTGAYNKLRGHGRMGFAFIYYDEETDEVFGEEAFTGLVQRNQ
jgi:hypothetical protein